MGRVQRAALLASVSVYSVALVAGTAYYVASRHRLPGIVIDPLRDAQVYLARGDERRAAREYRVGSRVGTDYELAKRATELRGAIGDPVGEIDQYLLGRDLAPRDPGAHRALGRAYGKNGRVEEAVASFRNALNVEPGDTSSLMAMGDVLLDHDRYEGAASAFRSAIALGRRDAAVHNSLGIAYALQGQFPAAVSEFEEAVRLDPSPAIRANLDRARAGAR